MSPIRPIFSAVAAAGPTPTRSCCDSIKNLIARVIEIVKKIFCCCKKSEPVNLADPRQIQQIGNAEQPANPQPDPLRQIEQIRDAGNQELEAAREAALAANRNGAPRAEIARILVDAERNARARLDQEQRIANLNG